MKKLYFLGLLLISIMGVNSAFAQVTYNLNQAGLFNPTDISTSGIEVSLGDDEVSSALPIGFTFDFYGNEYNSFHISSNGLLMFTPSFASGIGSTGCCNGQLLPEPSDPNNLIALAWEDLDPGNGGQPLENIIRYETIGLAPNRILVVEYYNVDHWPNGNNVTTQAKLFESSNNIEIHTTSLPSDGGNHTQGVENIDGTQAVPVPGRNRANFNLTNDFVQFIPTGETRVIDSQCGSTLENHNSIVYSKLVTSAERYKFRVTNLTTTEVVEKEYVLRNLYMSSLSNFQYNQTYSVEVAVRKAGVWKPYGVSCNITTSNPTTQLRVADCGFLKQRNDVVYADIIRFAQGYRFKVINLSTNSEQIIDRSTRSLYLNTITDYIPNLFSRGGGPNSYFISVAVKNTDGNYLVYGNNCYVQIGSGSMPFSAAKQIDDETTDVFKAVGYPNPFSNSFSIELNSNSNSKVSIVVYDMLGKQLEYKEINASEINSYQVGSNLSTGVYQVILTQDDNTQTMRMVKR
jgi:hypothetical protein